MADYEKYICTELQKKDMLPGPAPAEREMLAAEGWRIGMEHILWIDDEVIPGAYYGEASWIWPKSYPSQISQEELIKRTSNPKPMFPHAHEFPELLSWWGGDLEHPENTTAMGMQMGDEEIPALNSWVAYIPAGMKHMPTRPAGGKVSTGPVFHWTFGPGAYTRDKDESEPETVEKIEEANTDGRGNGRYLIFGNEPGVKRPDFMLDTDPAYTRPVAIINEDVIPGAELGCEAMWLLPGEKSKAGQLMMEAHTQPHGTHIVFNGMNYDDITDLCAEVELWIGGEKHIINKSFGAYIPPNVEQGPMIIRNVTRQVFYLMAYPIGAGIKKYPGG